MLLLLWVSGMVLFLLLLMQTLYFVIDIADPFRDCCIVVFVSRLPLLERVPAVVAAAVVFQLHLEGRTCWLCS